MAHEINNPLTTIIGLATLLADEKDALKVNEHLEDLQMINIEARRARDIVRNLLDFARADTLNPQTVDFNQLIEEAILLVYTQGVSYQIELNKELRPLPLMFLDSNQMKQVIVNLLNNSVQAMIDHPYPSAVLSIETEVIKSDDVVYSDNGNDAWVAVKISDTGSGISSAHLDKIFDPFFTTKEVGQGTGLGLSISYGIVKNHGGNITVESEIKQGTTFTLTLPVGSLTGDRKLS
ncbi:MAG: ATP-binding protein [Chloroflexota bacterium]